MKTVRRSLESDGGLRHTFVVRPDTWDMNILSDVFGRDEYSLAAYRNHKHDVKTIFDIGAHIGGFSTLACMLWSEATVIAYEPDIDNVLLLTENIASFSEMETGGMMVFQNAIIGEGSEPRKVGFRSFKERAPYNTGSGGLDVNGMTFVDAIPIGCLYAALHPDIVKIDTEGAEVEIVEGIIRGGHALHTGLVVGEYHGDVRRKELAALAKDFEGHEFLCTEPGFGKDCGLFRFTPRP